MNSKDADKILKKIDEKNLSKEIIRVLQKLYDHIALEEERILKNREIIDESKDEIQDEIINRFEEIGDEQAVALLIKGRLILRRRVGRNNLLISLVVLYQVADRFDTAVFGVTQQNGLLVRVGMDRHRTFRGCRIRFFLFCHNSKILMVGMSLQRECMTLI